MSTLPPTGRSGVPRIPESIVPVGSIPNLPSEAHHTIAPAAYGLVQGSVGEFDDLPVPGRTGRSPPDHASPAPDARPAHLSSGRGTAGT